MFDLSRDEITGGSLPRALLVLTAPLVVQQYVVVVQQIVDVFWLGRVSRNAVSAVGLVAPLIGLLALATSVATIGCRVLVAQHVGADDAAAARSTGFHATVLVGAANLLLAVVVLWLAPDLVGVLLSDEAVIQLGATYLTVTTVGRVFGGMSDTIESGFVGWGDSRMSMLINVVAVLTNVVLDPFLVVGWQLPGFAGYGIFGAALATALGYVAGFTVAVGGLGVDSTSFSIGRADLGVSRDTVRSLLSVGVPHAGQEAGRQIARLLVVAIVAGVAGSAGLAAYTIGARIATVAFVPAAAVGSAVSSIVGQNVGAGNPDRATRATWLAAGATTAGMAVLGVAQYSSPATIVSVFAPTFSGIELTYTVAYLQILAVGYWAFGLIYPIQGGFNGAGKTTVSMVATLLQYWGVRLPVAALGAYVVVFSVPVHAAFWAITASNVACAVGVTAYFWAQTSGATGLIERAATAAASD
ncbi:MATE family efflux transporter [Halobacterium salinarum]|uniref:MATE family efflux transporter n=1 Tax=Halobacterium salinarum TaxID=2242 RepID=UPI001F15F9CE|nr:MATE family efflux transporter [Halobacterium salinarum]MCF2164481.1 MATE family efflux transporter [Halobacterium salinarum]MCF2167268.1 MATE family efflux transporter [Halobacterium salinarum]